MEVVRESSTYSSGEFRITGQTDLEDTKVSKLVGYTPNFYLDITCSNIECKKKAFKWEGVSPEQDFFLKTLSVYN